MTARERYLGGIAGFAAVSVVTVWALPLALRKGMAWGVLLAFLVQAPLGWWTIRSIGTERFQLVWVLGTAIRLATVAFAGFVLVPELRWPLVPALGGLVTSILALLLVEAVAAWRKQSEIEAR